MIKSMTGFGKSSLIFENREYQVEIRSVNHKYLDISVKMPRILSYLEDEVKKEISSKVKRGKIDVSIIFNNESLDGRNISINKEIATLYINELRKLAVDTNINQNIEVIEIAKMPDVLKIQTDVEDENIKKELLCTVKSATDKLIDMRTAEGLKIQEDLKLRIDEIERQIIQISEKSTGLIKEYVVKLETRIKEILKTDEIDKSRIAEEVVIYADKSSIEEEITRLNSHISQFRKLLNSDVPVGKKIDFLIQEMNREINTTGSKSNSIDITNGVIEIKTGLEDIREQVQNIE